MANSSSDRSTQVLTDPTLSRRFDHWTQSLLDLSKRNRLLYFKPKPNTTIKLVEPDLATIWQRLVAANKVHSFFGLEAEADFFDDEEEGDISTTPQRALRRDELRTDLADVRLGKTLLYLRNRGRSSVEEQGVVTLFVTFGLVKWNDIGKDGKPEEDIFSPLLLVPVTLQRESTRTPYTLKLWEEEVILNPALKFRLARDFKITLPDPDDVDDLDLAAYLNKAAAVIEKQPGWILQEQAFLGLFSFHKIAMYRDLRDHQEHAVAHDLVRALAGDRSAVPAEPHDLPQGSQLDDIPPHQTWQIVDADSSQLEAIAAARRGVSFVLQGPPGTGKSQTITNIIADCLADGKKVLFVSEKMAALQVVYNRLAQNGLRDFCLEAHSHKSNKREVVQELDRTLRAGRPTVLPHANTADELLELRRNLNDYASQLHERRQPAGVSIYEAIASHAKLGDALPLGFSFEEPLKVSAAQRTQIAALLSEMIRLHTVLQNHETHPWRGTSLQEADLQLRDEITTRFTRLATSLKQIDSTLHEVLQTLDLVRFPCFSTTRRILQLTGLILESPLPPRQWLEDAQTTALRSEVEKWRTRFNAYHSRRADFTAAHGVDYFSLPRTALTQSLFHNHNATLERVVHRSDISAGQAALHLRKELCSGLDEIIESQGKLLSGFAALKAALHSTLDPTLTNAVALGKLGELVAQDPRPQPHWFEEKAASRLEQAARQAEKDDAEILDLRKRLDDYDIEKLFTFDLEALLTRFTGQYRQAQQKFDSQLRADLDKLSSFSTQATPITYPQAVRDIKIACNAHEQQCWLRENAAELSRVFTNYQGFGTDWTQAQATALANVQEIRDLQSTFTTAREQLAQRYDVEALLKLPHASLREEIQQNANSFWRFLNSSFKAAVNTVQATRLSPAKASFTELIADLELAAATAGHQAKLQSLSSQAQTAYGERFKEFETPWHTLVDYITTLSQEAQAHNKMYDAAAQKLDHYHLLAFLGEDLPALHDRFTNQYEPLVRIIEEDLARDIALLVATQSSSQGTSLSLHHWIEVLQTALSLSQREEARDNKRPSLQHDFGRHYNGDRTDWAMVRAALKTCEQIAELRKDIRWESLQQVLVESGEQMMMVKTHTVHLKSVMAGLQPAMQALHKVFPLRNLPFSPLPAANTPLPDLKNYLEQARASFTDFFAAYDEAGQGDMTLETIQQNLTEAETIEQERLALESLADKAHQLFEHFYNGLQTDWDAMLTALAWSEQFLQWFNGNDIPAQTLEAATQATAQKQLKDPAQRLQALTNAMKADGIFFQKIFPNLEIDGRPAELAELSQLPPVLEECVAHIDELDHWLAWQRLENDCKRLGLANFWRCALNAKPEATQIESAFWHRFWALWLDHAMRNITALRHFSGDIRNTQIERFRELDRKSLDTARNLLPAHLAQSRPRPGAARVGEVATLQREALKKSRHKALRVLFSEIPTVLQALKPCLLMSPLSVAQFLEPGKINFDVVIFDEASQICSEDAVGAIMRGSQLIVVGDRKQLPPTRYFGSTLDDEEDEETEGGEVFESILDECATMGLTDKMLLWHYRSRNEDLIAFSNQHFYESRLVTFPGPDSADTRGVSFENIHGTYIRGKGKDARTNPAEAKRIAELVIEHFETRPQESLGVIAFNEAQMSAIQNAVLRLVATRPHLDHILNSDGPDHFFIKNLENVQGDERDVILFSIGYGPDKDGKFSMNFGPLNRAGGERRLNVAVTRARLRVHVVASFEPEEIRATIGQGPKLLAQYLSFAKQGNAPYSSLMTSSTGNLEEVVAQALEARGWQVERSVGYSELRIDIAVRDPKDNDSFLLGIECDGPSYVSAKTARDRDRLRAQMLDSLGWTLLRVWSPDWMRDPAAQIERIEKKIEELQNKPASLPPPVVPAASAPQHGTQPMPHPTLVLPVQPRPASHGAGYATQVLSGAPSPTATADTTPLPAAPTSIMGRPAGTVWYEEANPRYQGTANDFYELAQWNCAVLGNNLAKIVKAEGPIRLNTAARRLVAAWGFGKVGKKLFAVVEEAAHNAQKRSLLTQRDDFLWPMNMTAPPVRIPRPGDTPRPIEDIALEEIAQAALLCIRDCYALPQEELINQTARLLGFKQTGINVRTRIELALERLKDNAQVQMRGDTWTLV